MLKDYILLYLKGNFSDVPVSFYVLLLVALCLGAILSFYKKELRKGLHLFAFIILIEVVVLIFSATVFFRVTDQSVGYNLIPFWSYSMPSKDLQYSMYVENLMNVLMFIPFGFSLGEAFKSISWKTMIIIAMLLSLSIETLQFFLKKGFAEVDDVLHNTLGCLIGYGVYKGGIHLIRRIQRKRSIIE